MPSIADEQRRHFRLELPGSRRRCLLLARLVFVPMLLVHFRRRPWGRLYLMIMRDAVHVPHACDVREDQAVDHGAGRRKHAHCRERVLVVTGRAVLVGETVAAYKLLPQISPPKLTARS